MILFDTFQVVKRAKLTHVAFSKSEPIIIVGDDRGGVTQQQVSYISTRFAL